MPTATHATAGLSKSDMSNIIDDAVDRIDVVRLSDREREVMSMMLKGHSNCSIALNLGITEGTVKIHRRNSYRKLSISSQVELFQMVLGLAVRGQHRATAH
ncbi:MAG: helix-turn-helix transcriptional regulator [Pseudomonadota bacterium]|nr:helix-turn-helix transcriptional regulator [Pseudomonadota bacterium]